MQACRCSLPSPVSCMRTWSSKTYRCSRDNNSGSINFVHLFHRWSGTLMAVTRTLSSRHAAHATPPESRTDFGHQPHDIWIILVLRNVCRIAHYILHGSSHLWILESLHQL